MTCVVAPSLTPDCYTRLLYSATHFSSCSSLSHPGLLHSLGDGLRFGRRLQMSGCKVLALMCMSNVDGSGRRINVIVHAGGIKIEAGCFGGSLDEFCEKAGREGKTRYVRVVRAAAEALQADVIEKGITGGWDEEGTK